MSITQRRTLVVLSTAVAALLALLFGLFVGESLARDGAVTTDEAADTSDPADEDETPDASETTETTPPTEPESTSTTAPTSGEPSSTEPSTTAPAPDPEPEEPETPATGCDAPHGQGTWTVDGPGESVAVNDIAPFGGDCAGVEVTLDAPVSDVTVDRFAALNTTIVRFDGSGPEPGPIGNDFIDFDVTDDRIWRAVVTSDIEGMGVLLYHPGEVSNTLGAHVDIEGSTLTLSIRERVADDPPATGVAGGEPYHRLPRGPFWDGLLVDLLVDAEGSGLIALQGLAQAPESHLEFQVFDASDDSLVCEETGMTQGAMWHFSRYEFTCEPGSPGTYDVVVGWPSLTDDPADAVWHIDEVTVG